MDDTRKPSRISAAYEKACGRAIDGNSQLAYIRLNVNVELTAFTKPAKKFVSVNLSGTNVAASTTGGMAHAGPDDVGWYTEAVDVQLSLRGGDVRLKVDSPPTTIGMAATTFSAAIDVNTNAGTFGPIPTGSVGAGVVIGQSVTRNLTDLKLRNQSTDNLAWHRYLLATTADGAAYARYDDLLLKRPPELWMLWDLRGVPDIAVANLPLDSQAIWVSDGPDPADTVLDVLIKQTLMRVEKSADVLDGVHLQPTPETLILQAEYPISFSSIEGD